jgi:hypothetical protein
LSFICKSFTKRRSTCANGWKRQRIVMISSNWTIKKIEVNTCIILNFFLTCANPCTRHNHVNRSGEGFKTTREDFQEIKTWTLIMCFCVMFPNWLLHIDGGEHKSFDALFYHLMNKNMKHQKEKNKNAWQQQCQMGWWPYELQEYPRYTEHWHKKHVKFDGMTKDMVNLDERHQWYYKWDACPIKRRGETQ